MSVEQYITILTSLATLVNSLILWPLFRGQKATTARLDTTTSRLDARVAVLERR